MTEEEKKAIERINNVLFDNDKSSLYIEIFKDDTRILLNLIQKQNTEINKLKKINDLMASSILNYDDQLEINYYKDKEHVKETFTEYAMKEDK